MTPLILRRAHPRTIRSFTGCLSAADYRPGGGNGKGKVLLNAAEVTVEPTHDFLDDLAVLGDKNLVAAGIEDVFLVGARRAQCLEQRPSRGLNVTPRPAVHS